MRDPTADFIETLAKLTPSWAIALANTIFNAPVEKWLTVVVIFTTLLQAYLTIRDRVVKHRRASDEGVGKNGSE